MNIRKIHISTDGCNFNGSDLINVVILLAVLITLPNSLGKSALAIMLVMLMLTASFDSKAIGRALGIAINGARVLNGVLVDLVGTSTLTVDIM